MKMCLLEKITVIVRTEYIVVVPCPGCIEEEFERITVTLTEYDRDPG